MKVAIVGKYHEDGLEYHLLDSFRHLGHDTKVYDFLPSVFVPKKYDQLFRKFSDAYDVKANLKLAERVIAAQPDLLVVTLRTIHPILVTTVKEKLNGITAIHINPDAVTTFQKQQIFVGPFDHYFTKDPFIVRFMIDKMGLNAHYMPEAFNPRVHIAPEADRKELEREVGIDVLVFGNLYPYRTQLIKKLINDGINVQIFGNRGNFFPKELESHFSGEYIIKERKAWLLYGSKIVFNNFHYAEIESVNCKYFEINGIGGFQICDYKEVEKYYSEIDPSLYTYKTYDEALSLIRHYLVNPEERRAIADQQKAYALENHTYDHRIKSILSIIDMK